MILIAGIPSEEPLKLVLDRLILHSIPHVVLNQRDVLKSHITLEVDRGILSGKLELPQDCYPLSDFTAIYSRMMDVGGIPEVKAEIDGADSKREARQFQAIFENFLDISPARVLNRPRNMASNNSKPFQAQHILAAGFSTPRTLITNDANKVRLFQTEVSAVIFKSISGVRSIVRELCEADFSRMDSLTQTPVQFQQRVAGYDVRVHVVDKKIFATRIFSDAVDYRYASQQSGSAARLEPFDLPDDIAQKCCALSRDLKLPFAGIDLRIGDDGLTYCFEVNPSPGYSYYENNTNQPISLAVMEHMMGL